MGGRVQSAAGVRSQLEAGGRKTSQEAVVESGAGQTGLIEAVAGSVEGGEESNCQKSPHDSGQTRCGGEGVMLLSFPTWVKEKTMSFTGIGSPWHI